MVDVQESIGKPRLLRWTGALARLRHDRRARYLAVGAVSAVVYYSFFTVGWLAFGGVIPYLVLAVLANAATAVLTYPLYRRGVWRVAGQGPRGFLRFYLVCLWALAFTLIGLPVLVEWVRLPVLLAQAIILVTGPLINYQMLRLWTFRHRSSTPKAGA